MKRSLFSLLILVVFNTCSNANDRYLYLDKPIFGIVGCNLDGTVKFALGM
jgi:hypothetical protein